MKFGLRGPCAHCPFRSDVPPFLRRERCVEIAQSLAEGAGFPCHKTTVVVEDERGEEHLAPGPSSQFCAGALLVLEHMEQPNQLMRIAEGLGEYDPDRLDRSAPVVRSLTAFADHHGQDEEDEPEPCAIADPGCLAPAGYMVGGSVVPADREGETHECPGWCGNSVCDACSDDDGRCAYCAEHDPED